MQKLQKRQGWTHTFGIGLGLGLALSLSVACDPGGKSEDDSKHSSNSDDQGWPSQNTGPHDPNSHDSGPFPDDHGDPNTGPGDTGWPEDCTYCNRPRPRSFAVNLSAAVGLAIVSNENEGQNKTNSNRRKFSRAGTVIGANRGLQPLQSRNSPIIMAKEDDDLPPGSTDPVDPNDPADPVDPNDPADPNGDGQNPPGDMPENPEDDSSNLLKLDEDGTLEPAMVDSVPEGTEDLTEEELEQMWDPGPLPRITAMGLSPDGSVYVLFERPFIYRMVEEEDMNEDIWSASSPYTCQLFHSDAVWMTDSSVPDSEKIGELDCVTNQHEIPTWQTDMVMQFDAEGNLYFPAAIPGIWKQVFYSYNPDTNTLSEKVNANICWHNVEVTPRGSIFYTGTSSSNGDCNGSGFFRYISPDNRLVEIARDWWNFQYFAEQDPDDPNSERIVFYGPNPNSDSQNGWESACLYRYDPQISNPEDRVSAMADCINNGWDYVFGKDFWDNGGQGHDVATRAAVKSRCESEGNLFIGGEGISNLSQSKDGTILVAGTFRQKIAGTFGCHLEVQSNHCDNVDPTITSAEDCEAAGANWVNTESYCSDPTWTNDMDCFANGGDWTWGEGSRWYNDINGLACLVTDDPGQASPDDGILYRPGWTVNGVDCKAEGSGDFTQQISGFAFLGSSSNDETPDIQLISGSDEKVEAFWVINFPGHTEFFYSTYASGIYNLRTARVENNDVVRRTLLSDYEVYAVHRDPSSPSRVLFDGLYFPTNSYMFGSIDSNLQTEEEILASLELMDGVTGEIETLIILPDF